MISILKMLPEVGQLVNFKYQYGANPAIYTATNVIWVDDIQHNYHVIEWEPVE